jgi:hypothetical protein
MTSVPTDDALYADLRAARTRGLNNPDKPLDDLKALLEVAQVVSLERDESAKLEDALKKAIERLGGAAAASIMALMGLTSETRGHGVKFRRIKAAALYDFKTYEVFRKRHEPALLMSVATHLSVLAEQQNVDRQDRENHKEKSTLLQGDSFSGWPFYRTAETELEAIIGNGLIGASEKGLAPMLTTFAAGTSAYKNKTEIQKLEEILLWAITASEGHPLWTRVGHSKDASLRRQGVIELLGFGSAELQSLEERRLRAAPYFGYSSAEPRGSSKPIPSAGVYPPYIEGILTVALRHTLCTLALNEQVMI